MSNIVGFQRQKETNSDPRALMAPPTQTRIRKQQAPPKHRDLRSTVLSRTLGSSTETSSALITAFSICAGEKPQKQAENGCYTFNLSFPEYKEFERIVRSTRTRQFKWDYSLSGRQLRIPMPSIWHETRIENLNHFIELINDLMPAMYRQWYRLKPAHQSDVMSVRRCRFAIPPLRMYSNGVKDLECSGERDELKFIERFLQPDNQWFTLFTRLLYGYIYPSVILEVAVAQTYEDMIRKLEDWIQGGRGRICWAIGYYTPDVYQEAGELNTTKISPVRLVVMEKVKDADGFLHGKTVIDKQIVDENGKVLEGSIEFPVWPFFYTKPSENPRIVKDYEGNVIPALPESFMAKTVSVSCATFVADFKARRHDLQRSNDPRRTASSEIETGPPLRIVVDQDPSDAEEEDVGDSSLLSNASSAGSSYPSPKGRGNRDVGTREKNQRRAGRKDGPGYYRQK
ncbi:hypothetical protein BJ508DRAFT_329140 [Ascobolus immersus RN42]|uniref:Uncharacterized protein n=1 Tax=Ascobolus immersus RN42 TaxID=1160509 RepID=A0A3N4HXG4_ASCIM|nr:hypothetical protein BJ508DRAFT_329140 [Ascobolus immersus RN42]